MKEQENLKAKKTLNLNRNGSDYKVFSDGSPCWARTMRHISRKREYKVFLSEKHLP